MSNRIFRLCPVLPVLLAVAGLCAGVSSCEPEGITDTSEFTLYYPGITDIGPSTNFTVSPTWHGDTPSGFSIYRITYEGKKTDSECFSVDPDTGEVALSGTEGLAVGRYAICISCISAGKEYRFDDAVTVNMMKPVPD